MRKTLSILLISTLTLTACSTVRDSAVNPFNWFGSSRAETLGPKDSANPLIPERRLGILATAREKEAEYFGIPFDQVTDLTVERVPGGALIRATGLAARQGYFDVRLTSANEDGLPVDGVLTFRLEGVRPAENTPVGPAATREVVVARHLTDQDLKGVRAIRVEGQQNALVSRR